MALTRNPPPKKQPRPAEYRRTIEGVELHLDDVDDLLRMLRSRTAAVTLRAQRAVADDADDLKDATGAELREISLATKDPTLAIQLHRQSAYATTTDTSDEAKALVEDVLGLVSVRRKPFLGLSPDPPLISW